MATKNDSDHDFDVKVLKWLLKSNEITLKKMEEALRNDVEYPSSRERIEEDLASMKGRRWFIIRKYLEYKLKKGISKTPKKLDEEGRLWLKRKIERTKDDISHEKEDLD